MGQLGNFYSDVVQLQIKKVKREFLGFIRFVYLIFFLRELNRGINEKESQYLKVQFRLFIYIGFFKSSIKLLVFINVNCQ